MLTSESGVRKQGSTPRHQRRSYQHPNSETPQLVRNLRRSLEIQEVVPINYSRLGERILQLSQRQQQQQQLEADLSNATSPLSPHTDPLPQPQRNWLATRPTHSSKSLGASRTPPSQSGTPTDTSQRAGDDSQISYPAHLKPIIEARARCQAAPGSAWAPVTTDEGAEASSPLGGPHASTLTLRATGILLEGTNDSPHTTQGVIKTQTAARTSFRFAGTGGSAGLGSPGPLSPVVPRLVTTHSGVVEVRPVQQSQAVVVDSQHGVPQHDPRAKTFSGDGQAPKPSLFSRLFKGCYHP